MKHRPEYNNKLIGKNLRRCRQAKNLSVEQVREYLRLGSLQAIYKWEEGRGYPQADTMFALMELYGIGLPDLLREEEKENHMTKESGLKRLALYWKYLHDFQRNHFNDKFNDNSYNFC